MPSIIPACSSRSWNRISATDAANVMVLLGHPITSFPLILGLSLVGCLLGTYLTKPEEEAVLNDFYRRVRPWGFWGPDPCARWSKTTPASSGTRISYRDMFNIVVGTIWQTCFIVLAMFLVTRHFRNAAITLVVLVSHLFILKLTWYDKLPAPTPDPVPNRRARTGRPKLRPVAN